MIKTFEQHLDLLRRNIGTAVEHLHAPHALSSVLEAMERDVDPSPFRREFERIGQEIDIDFLYFVPVEGNEIIRHVRPEVKLDALLVQDALEHLVDFHEEDVQPLQRVAGLHLAVFVLAEIKHLGDQVEQTVTVPSDDQHALPGGFGQIVPFKQLLHRVQDQGERRLEIV